MSFFSCLFKHTRFRFALTTALTSTNCINNRVNTNLTNTCRTLWKTICRTRYISITFIYLIYKSLLQSLPAQVFWCYYFALHSNRSTSSSQNLEDNFQFWFKLAVLKHHLWLKLIMLLIRNSSEMSYVISCLDCFLLSVLISIWRKRD